MTITEFLLARIAEDEEVAESAANLSNGGRWWVDPNAAVSGKHWIYDIGEKFTDHAVADHIARHNPARVLAECAAKRAIVEQSVAWDATLHETAPGHNEKADTAYRMALHWTMGTLAAVYADHPDYDQAWRM